MVDFIFLCWVVQIMHVLQNVDSFVTNMSATPIIMIWALLLYGGVNFYAIICYDFPCKYLQLRLNKYFSQIFLLFFSQDGFVWQCVSSYSSDSGILASDWQLLDRLSTMKSWILPSWSNLMNAMLSAIEASLWWLGFFKPLWRHSCCCMYTFLGSFW